jgi:hypothetical protein
VVSGKAQANKKLRGVDESASTVEFESSEYLVNSTRERAQSRDPLFPGRVLRITILTALAFLVFTVLLASDTASAEPGFSRNQSPIEPALTKLHELYMATGTPVDPEFFGAPVTRAGMPHYWRSVDLGTLS